MFSTQIIACTSLLAGFVIALTSLPAHALQPVTLPLPHGQRMVFVPVCVAKGSSSFSWKKFRVGDPTGGYKETPAAVVVGGSFHDDATSEWCYYLGETEVTEGQYAALMNTSVPTGETFPVRQVSWFDAIAFADKLNKWLYANHMDRLPTYGGVPGFVRLPSEVEWEFAARGGAAVDRTTFDQKTPYKRIVKHEWYAGAKSSHGKVKKVRKLKPNQLGLYDMLGNVSEMTQSLYQVEYYQGRAGGFVAKGGHYLTSGKKLRSSLRSEQGFYHCSQKTKALKANKQATLGFRLMISSLVFPSAQVSRKVAEDWQSYQHTTAATLPAASSTQSVSTQVNTSISDVQVYINNLQSALRTSGNSSPEVQREMKQLQASVASINKTIKDAEHQAAFSWIKILGEKGYVIYKEERRWPRFQNAADSARRSLKRNAGTAEAQNTKIRADKYEDKVRQIQAKMDLAFEGYLDAITQLTSSADEAATRAGFEKYRKWLLSQNSPAQIRVLAIIQSQVRDYRRTKRLKKEKWLEALKSP